MARYNRNPNPALDNNITGWSVQNTKLALRRVATASRPDNGAAGFIGDARSNGTARARIWTSGVGQGLAPVVVGNYYWVSIWVYQGSGATQNVRLDVDACNSSGAYVSTAAGSPVVAVPNNTMTRISHAVLIPSGISYLSTYVEFYTTVDNTYVAVSSAMVEDTVFGSTLPNYRDGGYTGWNWTGTAGNSQSRNLDPVANAGPDQTVTEGDTVNLNGTATTDDNTDAAFGLGYEWTVLDAGGTSLTTSNLASRFTRNPSFTAPDVTANADIVIQMKVTDPDNTSYDTVTITVEPSFITVDITGSGGLVVGGAATVGGALSELVTGSGGLRVGQSALPPLVITPTILSGSEGVSVGGTSLPPMFQTPTQIAPTGDGLRVGGEATVRFRAQPAAANLKVEWDLDNDGDFSEAEEDITSYVMSVETQTGRDWPSMLSGRATPGKMKIQLYNKDDIFYHFNPSSPLNTAPYALKVGTKIRLRTQESESTDPVLLVRDKFNRAASTTMGTADTGQTWTDSGMKLLDFAARPEAAGTFQNARINVGVSDYYIQCSLGTMGRINAAGGNNAGLIYRYLNDSNFSRLQYWTGARQIQVVNRVSGVDTSGGTYSIEEYDERVIGVHVVGTTAHVYTDGVKILETTAPAGTVNNTIAGIFATQNSAHPAPSIDDFYVWDKVYNPVEGVIWTGTVDEIEESTQLGPIKTVNLSCNGPLARAAATEVTPTNTAYGRKTGLAVGNTLYRSGLLFPPGPIDIGDVTTGAFGYERNKVIELIRNFEEAEFGFLYETPEGFIGFDSRTARDGRTSQATFADFDDAQLGYHSIEPKNWRNEIVNRVESGISPEIPFTFNIQTKTEDPIAVAEGTAFYLTATDYAKGDLILVFMSASAPNTNTGGTPQPIYFTSPSGWESLDGKAFEAQGQERPWISRVFARVCDGTEQAGDLMEFAAATDASGQNWSYCMAVYHITSWYGSIKDGIILSDFSEGLDSPAVFPDWGPEAPSTFFTVLFGGDTSGSAGTISGLNPPPYYTMASNSPLILKSADGWSSGLAWASKIGSTSVENAGSWFGTFSGFSQTYSVTIAVRGKNGEPPVKNGVVTVQADDVQSQEDHNLIKTYRESANIFASEADADAYNALVLSRYSDDRPIVEIKFWGSTTQAHRNQAVTRRVGDRITLEANNQTGMGYSGDFFIENISHKITNGGKKWEVTWELSPVPA